MKWFKMLWLNSEERQILKEGKRAPEPISPSQTVELTADFKVSSPAYKNLFYSNQNLTVVFNDGTMTSKSGVDSDTFYRVKNAFTQQEVEKLLIEKTVDPEVQ